MNKPNHSTGGADDVNEQQEDEGNLDLWEYYTSNFDTDANLRHANDWNFSVDPSHASPPRTFGSDHEGATALQDRDTGLQYTDPTTLSNTNSHSLGQLATHEAFHTNNMIVPPGQRAGYGPHYIVAPESSAFQPYTLPFEQAPQVQLQQQQPDFSSYNDDANGQYADMRNDQQVDQQYARYFVADGSHIVGAGGYQDDFAMASSDDDMIQSLLQNHQADSVDGMDQKPAARSMANESTERSRNSERHSAAGPLQLNSFIEPAARGAEDPPNPPALPFRPVDKRCKPLTGYNYFYRVERDNIIGNMADRSDPLPPLVLDFSPSKMEQLLHQHWYVRKARWCS